MLSLTKQNFYLTDSTKRAAESVTTIPEEQIERLKASR
jgi:hypothetical protein